MASFCFSVNGNEDIILPLLSSSYLGLQTAILPLDFNWRSPCPGPCMAEGPALTLSLATPSRKWSQQGPGDMPPWAPRALAIQDPRMSCSNCP